MDRLVGTVSRGVRAPIIRQGDDLVKIVVDSVLNASKSENFEVRDKDVIAVTEAVVARAQGNYAHVDNIAKDVKDKFGDDTVGVIFPILSRNRFAICLKGIAKGCRKVVLMLSYPSDEVGNHLISILTCDIHTRQRTKRILRQNGAKKVYSLDDIMTASVDGSGYNDQYGLLGSNKATEETVKLFPINCDEVVNKIQGNIKEITGKDVEVMVYGDGAFKDPVGKIWELADPVVSPAYTKGLEGTPNEVKLKYLADNDFADLSGDELKEAISKYIVEKDNKSDDLTGNMVSQGTTPRRLTDLIGSLADLTSGSGDKGTPIIYIQGYFDNYTK